jgi:hypothetical protein
MEVIMNKSTTSTLSLLILISAATCQTNVFASKRAADDMDGKEDSSAKKQAGERSGETAQPEAAVPARSSWFASVMGSITHGLVNAAIAITPQSTLDSIIAAQIEKAFDVTRPDFAEKRLANLAKLNRVCETLTLLTGDPESEQLLGLLITLQPPIDLALDNSLAGDHTLSTKIKQVLKEAAQQPEVLALIKKHNFFDPNFDFLNQEFLHDVIVHIAAIKPKIWACCFAD